MEKLSRLETCRFQRRENGEWEPGILMNNGSIGIIDRYGKEVMDDIWDLRTISYLVLDNIDITLDRLGNLYESN